MIQGLAVGVGAFAESAATHGKSGGPEEVQAYQQKEQESKIQAQQARDAQKDQQVRQAMMVGDTNFKMAQNIHYLATLPLEAYASHMKVQEAQQGYDIAGANFKNENWGFSAAQANGTEPIGPQNVATAQAKLSRYLGGDKRGAVAILGKDDPAVQAAQAVLDNKAPSASDVMAAGQGLRTAQQQSVATAEAKTKQEEAAANAPLGDDKVAGLNAGLLQLYQVSNPGAKTLPEGMSLPAGATPKDYARIEGLVQHEETAKSMQVSRTLADQIRQQNLNLLQGPQGIPENLQGPEYVAAVAQKDPGEANELRAYGQGKLVLSPAVARTAQGQALTKQILRAYPQYNQANAPAYQKQFLEFTSGKIGQSLNSYFAATDHLNKAFALVSGASTFDLNNPAGKVHQQLDTAKEVMSSELAKAVGNGSLTEDEKAGMLAAIDGKVLKVETKSAYTNKLQQMVSMMKGKVDAYKSQWQSTAVPGAEQPSNLTDADEATQKLSGAAAPKAPSGKVVSLRGAIALPINQGKTEDQVRADIIAHGHQVGQ
jgi:hypothetical protein